jgi:hypothetical protein
LVVPWKSRAILPFVGSGNRQEIAAMIPGAKVLGGGKRTRVLPSRGPWCRCVSEALAKRAAEWAIATDGPSASEADAKQEGRAVKRAG